MSDITILKARLRKRDKDIQQAVRRLNLEEGEMADMVRDGFRRMLTEMGALGTKGISRPGPITPADAQLIAQELVQYKNHPSPQTFDTSLI